MKHNAEEFRKVGREVVEWMADYFADPGRFRVTPDMKPGDLIDKLPASGPLQGEPLERSVKDFYDLVLPAVVHWNHPRFLNYFGCTASTPAVLAEMLVSVINTNGFNWTASPAVAELEHVALAWLRQWMGLQEEFFGIIYDTASTSTLHALAAAREMADPDSRRKGTRPGLRVYCSDQAHSSVDKAVITLGMGLDNLVKIESDEAFAMRADRLEQAVENDLAAGLMPCAVVATVGTTSTTSVDPVLAIARIAKKYNLWLHVDSAYAGVCAMLPEYAAMFAGVEHADSLVMNPHKWMFVPVDTSVLYTRHPELLRRAFTFNPAYLSSSQDPRAVNLMDYGFQLGRRFRAVKLWFVMRYFGLEGLRKVLRRHMELAKDFESKVASDERFELTAPAPFSTVCFRLKGSDEPNRELFARVNASRETFISQTVLRGCFSLRVAVGNLATEQADMDAVWALIQREVKRLKEPIHSLGLEKPGVAPE